jgi:hypothetical protein
MTLGLLYLVLMVVVIGSLRYGRQWSIRTLDTVQARSQWQAYRQGIARQEKAGAPVQRQTPRSTEPPALVLLRDHFGSCLALSLLLVTSGYAAFSFFLVGVLRREETSRATGIERAT